MQIRQPNPRLTRSDERLLRLLEQLIAWRCHAQGAKSNTGGQVIPLTENEFLDLQRALENYVSNKEIETKIRFIERLIQYKKANDNELKKIHIEEKGKVNSTRVVMSNQKWREFKVRLGIIQREYMKDRDLEKMAFSHFIEMERRSFQRCGISESVALELIEFISFQRTQTEFLHLGRMSDKVSIQKILIDPILKIKQRTIDIPDKEISRQRLAAIMVFVCDFGMLFTTRDGMLLVLLRLWRRRRHFWVEIVNGILF